MGQCYKKLLLSLPLLSRSKRFRVWIGGVWYKVRKGKWEFWTRKVKKGQVVKVIAEYF